jgi:hypothetical protein
MPRLARFDVVQRYILATHLVLFGLLYWLGPPARSAGRSFEVIKSVGPPVWLWGLLCVAAGVLLFARQLIVGHAIGAVLLLFWGAALIVAPLLDGTFAPVGPMHCLALAAMHLWALNVHTREKAGAGG